MAPQGNASSSRSGLYTGEGSINVMHLTDEATSATVVEASAGVARLLKANVWTDLIAVGHDLAVVCPSAMDEDDWGTLCEIMAGIVDVDFRVVLVGQPYRSASLPRRNVAASLPVATVDGLRGAFARVSDSPGNKALWQRAEPRIVRLLDMIRRLDQGQLRLRDVAERFDVSLRTVQRDLGVLLCSDWPIQDAGEPGVYQFLDGWHSPCLRCGLLNPELSGTDRQ